MVWERGDRREGRWGSAWGREREGEGGGEHGERGRCVRGEVGERGG